MFPPHPPRTCGTTLPDIAAAYHYTISKTPPPNKGTDHWVTDIKGPSFRKVLPPKLSTSLEIRCCPTMRLDFSGRDPLRKPRRARKKPGTNSCFPKQIGVPVQLVFCCRNRTKIEARHESKHDLSTNTSAYFELVLASTERELTLLDLKLMPRNNLRFV